MSLSVRIRRQVGEFSLDVAFEAPPGATVLFGRSGSGKTTVANAVAGLIRPSAGRIEAQGRVLMDSEAGIWLPPHRRRIGYVFQEGRLFPHLSVRGNLAYGRWFAPGSRRPSAAEVARVVEMLGIGPLLDRRPGALSGGEKQRVAIGRALLSAPSMLIADEPLAALDEPRKAEILPYFERLRDELAIPILYVSHAPTEVARLATTVVALEGGRVLRAGPAAQVLADPAANPMGVRGAGAMLEATVRAHHPDGLTELDAGGERLFLPRTPHAPGARLRVRLPAQDVILSRSRPEGLSALNILPGRIETLREGEGPGTLVVLRSRAGLILARVTRRSAAALQLAPGVEVHAIVKTVAIAPEDVGGGGGGSAASDDAAGEAAAGGLARAPD